MAQREHAQRGTRSEQDVDEVEDVPATRSTELDADVDAILDEIDDVLEENAEDFVKSFVQKGGQ
jgi:ubiquitin-like protein Pup